MLECHHQEDLLCGCQCFQSENEPASLLDKALERIGGENFFSVPVCLPVDTPATGWFFPFAACFALFLRDPIQVGVLSKRGKRRKKF